MGLERRVGLLGDLGDWVCFYNLRWFGSVNGWFESVWIGVEKIPVF